MIRNLLFIIAALLTSAGCAGLIKAARPPRQGQFPMPDLRGKTTGEVKETLAVEGKTGSLDVQEIDCNDESVKEGKVCGQTPEPGQTTQAGGPTLIYIQAKRNTKMPDVTGKTAEEAKQTLAEAGFQEIEVRTLERPRPGCVPKRVCVTSPEAGVRAAPQTPKTIFLSPDEQPVSPPEAGKTPPGKPDDGQKDEKPPEAIF